MMHLNYAQEIEFLHVLAVDDSVHGTSILPIIIPCRGLKPLPNDPHVLRSHCDGQQRHDLLLQCQELMWLSILQRHTFLFWFLVLNAINLRRRHYGP